LHLIVEHLTNGRDKLLLLPYFEWQGSLELSTHTKWASYMFTVAVAHSIRVGICFAILNRREQTI
jgi:hypothetical protein